MVDRDLHNTFRKKYFYCDIIFWAFYFALENYLCWEGFLPIPLRTLVSIFVFYLYHHHPSYDKYKYLQILPGVTWGQNYPSWEPVH